MKNKKQIKRERSRYIWWSNKLIKWKKKNEDVPISEVPRRKVVADVKGLYWLSALLVVYLDPVRAIITDSTHFQSQVRRMYRNWVRIYNVALPQRIIGLDIPLA